MNFTDVSFLVTLAFALLVYRFIPLRSRWMYLLAMGALFYCTLDVRFLYALVAMMIGTYLGAWLLARATKGRLAILWTFILAIIGWLFVVKWPVTHAVDWFGPARSLLPGMKPESLQNLAIPIGLSFHALQCISVLVDTYRDPSKWNPSVRHFVLYLCYLPQILAGPIERTRNMYPQFEAPQLESGETALKGLELFARGMFMKLVIADRFAVILPAYAAGVSNYRDPLVAGYMILGWHTYLFSDLSGYTDMARGMSHWFGIRLKKNFDGPFHTHTIAETLSRWHVTLHHFFRDYVYKSVKESGAAIPFAVFAVMMMSGVWHGLGYHFLVWGFALFSIMMMEKAISHRWPGYLTMPGAKYRTYLLGALANGFFFMKTFGDYGDVFTSFAMPVDLDHSLGLMAKLGWQTQDAVIYAGFAFAGFFLFHKPAAEKEPSDIYRWSRLVFAAILILIFRYPKTSLHTYFQF